MKPQRLILSICSLWLTCLPAVAGTPPTRSIPVQFSAEERANIDVYRAISPAVVTIRAGNSSGSGSMIREDGLVLTNEHVVRSARGGSVLVRTSNGQQYQGQVIATDPRADLALVRLATRDRFPVVRLAAPEGIQVGQRVYAIGSPFGLSGTLTTGILNRIGTNGDLQTNAELNPGNSGGPLLNSRGELIGVNKAVIVSNLRGNRGFSIATSSIVARQFIQQHQFRTPDQPAIARPINPGQPRIARPPHPRSGPRLGVALNRDTLIIEAVQRGSLAADLGLRPGDRIIGINGRRVRSADELTRFLDQRPAAALLNILRNQRLQTFRVSFL